MKQLLAIALLLVAVACEESPASPTLPATFTLAPGATARAEDARVTFVRVESDSRCPIDANCVSAGEATILVRVAAAGLDGEYALSLLDAARRSVNHRGYVITFTALEPYRDTRHQPNPGDYRATIEVAK